MPVNCDENPKLIQWRSLSDNEEEEKKKIRRTFGDGEIRGLSLTTPR